MTCVDTKEIHCRIYLVLSFNLTKIIPTVEAISDALTTHSHTQDQIIFFQYVSTAAIYLESILNAGCFCYLTVGDTAHVSWRAPAPGGHNRSNYT